MPTIKLVAEHTATGRVRGVRTGNAVADGARADGLAGRCSMKGEALAFTVTSGRGPVLCGGVGSRRPASSRAGPLRAGVIRARTPTRYRECGSWW